MLPWQPNKMTTVHQTYKLGKQSSVYGSFLLPWQPNQAAVHPNFSYFELPLPKQYLYQIRYCFSDFEGVVI